MKPRFSLCIKSVAVEKTSPTDAQPKKKYTRHLSMHHEKEIRKKMDLKKKEIEQTIEYCRANNCKG